MTIDELKNEISKPGNLIDLAGTIAKNDGVPIEDLKNSETAMKYLKIALSRSADYFARIRELYDARDNNAETAQAWFNFITPLSDKCWTDIRLANCLPV